MFFFHFQATLAESSEYMFSALDGRAYVRSVTILLPTSWPEQCAPTATKASDGQRADVTVVSRGQPVWTQQSAGCGRPGDHIYLNYNSLSADADHLAHQFIKEFAKYRYGVFDEQGYTGDAVYPVCYHGQEGESPKVTGCSDLPIKDDG